MSKDSTTIPTWVEAAHMEVPEFFAVSTRLAPTKGQVTWHRYGAQPPLFEASCGASIQDDPPLRLVVAKHGCAECGVGEAEIAKINVALAPFIEANRLRYPGNQRRSS